MTLTLTVHRGTREIGGSCIELASPGGQRLILDAGRPLDAPRGAKGLLPATLDLRTPATVLFSHGHTDHWGLLEELPAEWTVWAGEKTAELIRLSISLFGGDASRSIRTWSGRPDTFTLGDFTVTPYLTDHSAPDAHMLLIECAGRRVLYTGDFRAHGRKARLTERMIASPPRNVDVLIMEGTNLASGKSTETEAELEEGFFKLAKSTPRHVFVCWSAQNVDRTVGLFHAARRSGRKLVVDLYGADVLQRVAPGTCIPVPGPNFPELKVVITRSAKWLYAQKGRSDWAEGMANDRHVSTSRKRLAEDRAIIMLRDSMLDEFERGGLGFTPSDAYVFSSWNGYLDRENPVTGWARAVAAGARTKQLHTSGHASPADLSRFAAAVAPKALVPVHGLSWDDPGITLPPVRRLADGAQWQLV